MWSGTPTSQTEVAPGRYSPARHSLADVVAAYPANNRTRNTQTWQTNGWQTNVGGVPEEWDTNEFPVVIRLPTPLRIAASKVEANTD